MPYFRPQSGYDERASRRNQQAGGQPFRGRRRGDRPPIEYVQPPPTTHDMTIRRERGPWMHTGNYIPLAAPLRQTEAGPIRPDMHMRTHQWRRWSGGQHGDRTGWHTMLPNTEQRAERSGRTQQQRRTQGRLTVQRFRGQSYSQSTQVLNRRR